VKLAKERLETEFFLGWHTGGQCVERELLFHIIKRDCALAFLSDPRIRPPSSFRVHRGFLQSSSGTETTWLQKSHQIPERLATVVSTKYCFADCPKKVDFSGMAFTGVFCIIWYLYYATNT